MKERDVIRITQDDFFTGLIANLAQMGIETIYTTGTQFDTAMESAYNKLAELAEEGDIKVPFKILRDGLHRRSGVAQSLLSNAVQSGVVTRNPSSSHEVHLIPTAETVHQYFKTLPLNPENWEVIAMAFISGYRGN